MTYKIMIYPERWESIEKLSLEDKGRILECIFEYEQKGVIPYDGYIAIIFGFIKTQLDYNRGVYDKRCEINKEVGKLGGRPKKDFENKEKKQKPNGFINNPSEPKKPNTNTNTNTNTKIIDKSIILYTQEKDFYNFVDDFVDIENPQIKYQISKNKNYMESQYKTIDMLIKDGYTIEAIQTVLQFIKQDEFWRKQIMSIKKLREKDKNGVPYIVRMIEKIQQRTPKVLDFDSK